MRHKFRSENRESEKKQAPASTETQEPATNLII